MRSASISRKTAETDVSVSVALDGTGQSSIATGIGFLDHMLELLARHALFDIEAKVVAICTSISTIPPRIAASRWARPSPRRSATSAA